MVDVEQSKRIIRNFLDYTGRGGFRTGVVLSVSPLKIKLSDKIELDAGDLYITDNCIGLQRGDEILRSPLKVGDGVLLICRPRDTTGESKYILLDRIQPYTAVREVSK